MRRDQLPASLLTYYQLIDTDCRCMPTVLTFSARNTRGFVSAFSQAYSSAGGNNRRTMYIKPLRFELNSRFKVEKSQGIFPAVFTVQR